jgi:hypothetical protein
MSGSISDPRAHGTCRSFGSPFLDLRKELTLRHGDWSATVARSPTPEYEWRVHMLHNLLGRTMAVLLGIFEQFTELMVGQPSQIIGTAGDGRCQPGAPGGMCKPARL